eukprot:3948453-Prymnesium_polylepis.1
MPVHCALPYGSVQRVTHTHTRGLWPMLRREAVSTLRALCGASSTRSASLRGLTGSRPVPST